MLLQDLALAVLAFSALQKRLGLRSTAAAMTRLVLAGGYDTRLAENREYFQELKQLVQQLGLEQQVRLGAAQWVQPAWECYLWASAC